MPITAKKCQKSLYNQRSLTAITFELNPYLFYFKCVEKNQLKLCLFKEIPSSNPFFTHNVIFKTEYVEQIVIIIT